MIDASRCSFCGLTSSTPFSRRAPAWRTVFGAVVCGDDCEALERLRFIAEPTQLVHEEIDGWWGYAEVNGLAAHVGPCGSLAELEEAVAMEEMS